MTQRCLVDFHLHTTVILTMHPWDVIRVNINFGILDKEISKTGNYLSDKFEISSQGSAYLETHAFYATEFWLDELWYDGDITTIRPALVNVGGNPVINNKINGSAWNDPDTHTDTITERGGLHLYYMHEEFMIKHFIYLTTVPIHMAQNVLYCTFC